MVTEKIILTLDEKVAYLKDLKNDAGQIMFPTPQVSTAEFLRQLNTIMCQNNLPFNFHHFSKQIASSINHNLSDVIVKEIIKQRLYEYLNWAYLGENGLTPLTEDFCKIFSAIPNTFVERQATEKVIALTFTESEKNGLLTLPLFNDIAKDAFHIIELRKLSEEASQKNNTDSCNTFNDFKEEQASFTKRVMAFATNRNNPLRERWFTFLRFGERQSWIYEPTFQPLRFMFADYNDMDNQRGSYIDCDTVLDYWSENIIESKENDGKYISDAAVDKVLAAYQEILILEGVAGYYFDW